VILAWLRTHPLGGRLAVKLALALPLGLAAGLLLGWLCDAFGVTRNLAALGAAAVAVWASMRLAGRVAAFLGIPEP
jgi:hypothetical protein